MNALGLDIPVTKFAKPPAARSEFYNVELKVGENNFYGELTIIGYLLSIKNQNQVGAQYEGQGSSDLIYDNLLYTLNTKLRPACNAFLAEQSAEGKDTIKAIAKDLEENGVLEGLSEFKVAGAALAFSFLEPV